MLFKKFSLDFADKYMMPSIRLTPDAVIMLENYRWPGNVRQLKSIAEQISVIEHNRLIGPELLNKYLPPDSSNNLPVRTEGHASDYLTDRDIIFKILYQLRQEVEELKIKLSKDQVIPPTRISTGKEIQTNIGDSSIVDYEEDDFTETLSISEVNSDLIKRALEKNNGKRKLAAQELGISERTLYRKIKELNLD
ncbi:MAG TPA: hypothetical protein DF637_09125 [Rikenellaceae bacterium]|nr:hypothetical protein [Rikenellaceae bacterium]